MSTPASLVPEPTHGIERLSTPSDVSVFLPAPPRPDEHGGVIDGGRVPIADEGAGPDQERMAAAGKLAALVVVAGLGGGFALWAFGSAAVRAATGLMP